MKIETARCQVRASCKGNKEFDDSYEEFDLDTCIAYSKEHCRTRHIGGDNWNQKDVEACVEAILSLKRDCGRLLPKGVDETEQIGQCNFIDTTDAGLLDLTTDRDDSDSNHRDGGPPVASDGGA